MAVLKPAQPSTHRLPRKIDALRFEQGEATVRANAEIVNVEIRVLIVCHVHHRRRCRHDDKAAATPDPVDVAMAVHNDHSRLTAAASGGRTRFR